MKKRNSIELGLVLCGLLIVTIGYNKQLAKDYNQYFSCDADPCKKGLLTIPTINKITCNIMGGTTSYNQTLFIGYYIGDTESDNILTIIGSGFGSTQGTVVFEGVKSYKITGFNLWTDTKVEVKFRASYNSEPTTAAKIVLKTAGQSYQTVTKDIDKLAPAVKTRQYGECTWWASKRRRECGLNIPQMAYQTAGFVAIDQNYVPKKYDLWKWTSHQAFVENVIVTESIKDNNLNYTVTYNLGISEANADMRGTPNMQSATTVVIACTYNKVSKTYSRTIKSGAFKSIYPGSQATHYFR